MVRLDSRICPGCNGDPSSTNSSPVLSTATCGRRTTCTTAAFTPASIPATAGVTTVPAGYSTVPARTSSPAPRSESPACTAFEMAT